MLSSLRQWLFWGLIFGRYRDYLNCSKIIRLSRIQFTKLKIGKFSSKNVTFYTFVLNVIYIKGDRVKKEPNSFFENPVFANGLHPSFTAEPPPTPHVPYHAPDPDQSPWISQWLGQDTINIVKSQSGETQMQRWVFSCNFVSCYIDHFSPNILYF